MMDFYKTLSWLLWNAKRFLTLNDSSWSWRGCISAVEPKIWNSKSFVQLGGKWHLISCCFILNSSIFCPSFLHFSLPSTFPPLCVVHILCLCLCIMWVVSFELSPSSLCLLQYHTYIFYFLLWYWPWLSSFHIREGDWVRVLPLCLLILLTRGFLTKAPHWPSSRSGFF